VLGNAETDCDASCSCRVESQAREFVGGRVRVDSDLIKGDQFACSTEKESPKPEFIVLTYSGKMTN